MNEPQSTHHRGTAQFTSNRPPLYPQPLTRTVRLREWLGLERNILVMLAAVFTLGLGEKLWIRFVPKYLELLGATAWIIAIYGTLRDLFSAVYPYPGGWLADRLGRRASLVVFALLATVGYGLYLLAPGWEWILIGVFFVMAWSSLILPATSAIIGDNLPRSRRAIGFGVESIVNRVPFLLAPPLGGWLIVSLGLGTGMRVGLAITIALALIAVVIIRRYYVGRPPAAPNKVRFVDIWRGMDTRLKRLLVADCLVRWAAGIPRVFIVLYVINVLQANAFQFSWLISIQMLTSILVYVPVAKLSDRSNRKPFVLLTYALFALFPLALVSATGLSWVVMGFIIAGLREIGEPSRKALIVDLVNEEVRGRAVGMYYLLRGLVIFPASLVGGRLWAISPQLPFYVAFLVGVAGFLVYAIWGPAGGRRYPSRGLRGRPLVR